MPTLIGSSREEREAVTRNAAILAELVLLGTPLVRLAIRHGIPCEDLIYDLRHHIGMATAALEADVDGALFVDGPAAPEPPPVPLRKRSSLGSKKSAA